jgi:hypothetical protein
MLRTQRACATSVANINLLGDIYSFTPDNHRETHVSLYTQGPLLLSEFDNIGEKINTSLKLPNLIFCENLSPVLVGTWGTDRRAL